MSEYNLNFPKYFPIECPPEDATKEELTVYRYCENVDKVLPSDFITYYQGNPDKYKNNILAYGLSIMLDKEECLKGFKLPAIKKKFKGFSKGITYNSMGVVKRTPNRNSESHCTWWIYEGVCPEKHFKIEN